MAYREGDESGNEGSAPAVVDRSPQQADRSARRRGWRRSSSSAVCHASGGGSYFVHGSGCRVEAAEVEIDFDFNPDGSIPGFDPWKLYGFAQAHRENYPWLPDAKHLSKKWKSSLSTVF
jgi:hypothetical protein